MSREAAEALRAALNQSRETRIAIETTLTDYFRTWIESLDSGDLRYVNSYLTTAELEQRLLRQR